MSLYAVTLVLPLCRCMLIPVLIHVIGPTGVFAAFTGPGKSGVVVPLRERLLYTQDWLGLKTLDEEERSTGRSRSFPLRWHGCLQAMLSDLTHTLSENSARCAANAYA